MLGITLKQNTLIFEINLVSQTSLESLEFQEFGNLFNQDKITHA